MQLGPPVSVAFCKSHRHSEASLLAVSRSGRPPSGLLLCCSGPTSWTSAIQPVWSLADRRGSVHLAEVSSCVRISAQLLEKPASVVRVWGVDRRLKQIHWQHGKRRTGPILLPNTAATPPLPPTASRLPCVCKLRENGSSHRTKISDCLV